MVKEIQITNYKSIVDLTLELGRFNVIIGTNGSGKSNICCISVVEWLKWRINNYYALKVD